MRKIILYLAVSFFSLLLSAQAPVWVEQFETGNGSRLSGVAFVRHVNLGETGCSSYLVLI